MPGDFKNIYEDVHYADAYARLEFPGTYYLAFRDLPDVFVRHVRGSAGAAAGASPGRGKAAASPPAGGRARAPRKLRALDFGCGAGRSTRFLTRCGFDAVGVDISRDMVSIASQMDPSGDYRVIANGDFSGLAAASFDLVFAAFPFDNVPTRERKVRILAGLRGLLAPGGRLVNVVSSPEIYRHEWVSFTTRDFPRNRRARNGDVVRIINLAVDAHTPVEDVLWTEEAWRDVYAAAGFAPVEVLRPLAGKKEPVAGAAGPGAAGAGSAAAGQPTAGQPVVWVSETKVAPWVVWVLSPG